VALVAKPFRNAKSRANGIWIISYKVLAGIPFCYLYSSRN